MKNLALWPEIIAKASIKQRVSFLGKTVIYKMGEKVLSR